MIADVEVSIAQVKGMVMDGIVRSVQGKDVPVRADTLCIHGDQPNALAFAKRIRNELERAGVAVKTLAALTAPARMAAECEAEVADGFEDRAPRGERVARDEPIMMLELMKMEIPIAAPADGTLVRLLVAEGDLIAEGQQVAILETP
jgi:pyruvate carboxylase